MTDWTPATALPELASAVLAASRLARMPGGEGRGREAPKTSKPPPSSSMRGDATGTRSTMRTLLGIAEPSGPPSSGPTLPIVVPSADGSVEHGRAVITQIPRYDPALDASANPVIPRAPRVPSPVTPKPTKAAPKKEEKKPERKQTTSAFDGLWASASDDDAPTEAWEHAIPLLDAESIVDEPSAATEKIAPVEPAAESASPMPADVTPESPAATPKPPAATPKPSAATPKPPAATPKPPAATPKPPGVAPKPDKPTPPRARAEAPKPPLAPTKTAPAKKAADGKVDRALPGTATPPPRPASVRPPKPPPPRAAAPAVPPPRATATTVRSATPGAESAKDSALREEAKPDKDAAVMTPAVVIEALPPPPPLPPPPASEERADGPAALTPPPAPSSPPSSSAASVHEGDVAPPAPQQASPAAADSQLVDEKTQVLPLAEPEKTDLLPSSHLLTPALREGLADLEPQGTAAAAPALKPEPLPLPPPALPRTYRSDAPRALAPPAVAPGDEDASRDDRASLTSSVPVPIASLLGAGGALIFMVISAFFVGRCSAKEEPLVAHSSFQSLPVLARASLPPPLKPCWVARQPVRWAPEVDKSVPFDITATDTGTLAVGYAHDARAAVGVEIEPSTGALHKRFEKKLDDEVERVTPTPAAEFMVTAASTRGALSSAIPVPAPDPFLVGVDKDQLVVADRSGGSRTPLWPFAGEEGLSAARVQIAGEHGYGLIFRSSKRTIFSGWLGPDRKPVGELVKVQGSGGSMGKPNSGWNRREYAIIFADRPEGSDTWQIRVGRAPTGSVPAETTVIPLPKGGPGGDAFAPDIMGLSDGRWLLVWTEGSSGSRAVRAQTYAPDFTPLGDPIALSPPAGNFGQGVLGMAGNYASVVFLSKGASSYELWGAVLQCG